MNMAQFVTAAGDGASSRGVLILVALVVVWAVGYLISCWLWPWEPCDDCEDRPGRNWGSNRERWGTCKTCGGKGRQERFGVRFVRRKD
jgi:hypothetical protein